MASSSVASTGSMVRLTRLARSVYRRTSEEMLGMGLKQYATLATLRDAPVSQQTLGELMCIDANNLVLLLNGLEAAGWAARQRDPHDRRRHIVAISPAGVTALEGAERAMEAVEDEVLCELDPAERAQLSRLLGKALADR
ncbi:MAG TPA: MarR family winged helix-turn-helix transcriptional regulator [Solirubrobacteraceae bacterium]|nr:MarR family winged helix-turn-helix transcriptional regulator [Solirubrobacteraceae bacterium]